MKNIQRSLIVLAMVFFSIFGILYKKDIQASEEVLYNFTIVQDPNADGKATFFDDFSQTSGKFRAGEWLTILARQDASTGYGFEKWESSDIEVIGNLHSQNLKMPAKDVIIYAKYKQLNQYVATLDPKRGGNLYFEIKPESVYPGIKQKRFYEQQDLIFWGSVDKGFELDRYTVEGGDFEKFKLEVTGNQLRGVFSGGMPSSDIAITVYFKQVSETEGFVAYVKPVDNGGKVDIYPGLTAIRAKKGEKIQLRAIPESGYVFEGWQSTPDVYFSDSADKYATFSMPDYDVVITANFKHIGYKLTIAEYYNDATIGGEFTNSKYFAAGEVVNVVADNIPHSQIVFVRWMSDDVIISNPTSKKISFVMPNKDVVLNREHRQRKFDNTLKIQAFRGGKVAQTNVFGHLQSEMFEKREITAIIEEEKLYFQMFPDTEEGYEFDRFEFISKDEVKIIKEGEFEPIYNQKKFISFYMPGNDVELKIYFRKIGGPFKNAVYVADVEGGQAEILPQRVTNLEVQEGTDVILSVKSIQDGYTFKGWRSNQVNFDSSDQVVRFMMPDIAVTVTPIFQKTASETKYMVEVQHTEGGTASIIAEGQKQSWAMYGADENVTLKTEAFEGYEFDRWQSSANGTFSNTDQDGQTIFTMPANNVTLNAVFKKKEISKYTLSLEATEGGKAFVGQNQTSGSYAKDEQVELKAEPEKGYIFQKWETSAKFSNETNTKFSNETNPQIVFVMPASDVTIRAIFSKVEVPSFKLYTQSTEGGKIMAGISPGSIIIEGQNVPVIAEAEEGYTFEKWESNAGGSFEDVTNTQTIFTMPASDVTIRGIFKKDQILKYRLSMSSGNGGKGYISPNLENISLAKGEKVTIYATANAGYEFAGWSTTGGKITDLQQRQTTFEMEEADVTIQANFYDINGQLVTINMTYTGSGRTYIYPRAVSGRYKPGQRIFVRAVSGTGQMFDGWESQTGSFDDQNASNTVFTVPESNVSVRGRFKKYEVPKYTLKIESSEGGTGATSYGQSTEVSIEPKMIIELTANPQEGYVFEKWEAVQAGAEAGITEGNIDTQTIKYQMPEKNVTLKAIFKKSNRFVS